MSTKIKKINRRKDFLKSLCFLSPSLLGVGVFFILPFGVVVYYSMIDGVASKNFVFLENFTRLFQNSAFKMAAVNTLGVIYIVEKGGETIQSIEDLKGKTIYGTGKGSTPEYALTYLLAQHGMDIGTDVVMDWKSEPTEVVAQMATEEASVAMLPQPFVTVAAGQVENLRIALDLTKE